MNQSTDTLIRTLAGQNRPVQPLPRPWIRAAQWLIFSGIYMTLALFLSKGLGFSSMWKDPRFILEQAAALVLGIAAAVAAFASIIPGHNRRRLALLLIPLAAWLGTVSTSCIQNMDRLGARALSLEHNLTCFPNIVLLATVPAILMAIMLRRGAPLTPHLTTALGALAAAGLSNFVLRIFHPEDVTLMLLFWHVGGVFFLSALAASVGHYLLNWRAAVATNSLNGPK